MAQAKKTSTTRGRKSTANSRNNSRKSEPCLRWLYFCFCVTLELPEYLEIRSVT